MNKNKTMKKIKNILLVLGVFVISVCSAQKIQKEHFTTIDKLFYVEIGMTTNQVQTTLGVEPFDFYQNLSEGEMIIEYRYLHKKLEIKSKDNNYVKSKGEDYYTDAASIYCTYDKEGKLIAFYTDAGKNNSEDAYIWENTVIQYNTNPDCNKTCIIVDEDKQKSSKEENPVKTNKNSKKKNLFSNRK